MKSCKNSYNAGSLRERVILQNPSMTRSPSGAPRLGWATAGTVYAEVHGVSGRELIMAMQSNNLVSHRVTIRFRDDVDGETRMIWRGKTLEVVSALPRHNRTYLECMVREVVEGL